MRLDKQTIITSGICIALLVILVVLFTHTQGGGSVTFPTLTPTPTYQFRGH